MSSRSHRVVPLVVRRLGAVGAVLALVATPLRGVLACGMGASSAASVAANNGAPHQPSHADAVHHAAVEHAAVDDAGVDDATVHHAAGNHAAMGHHDGAPGEASAGDTDTDTGTDESSHAPAMPDCHAQMGCLVLAEVSAVGAIGSSPVPAGAPMPALVVAPEAPAPVVEPPPPRR
jgi:hypothetical protein